MHDKHTLACLLCGSSAVKRLASVRTSDLSSIYQRTLGVDVSRLFSAPELSLVLCTSCELRFFHPPAIGDAEFYEQLSEHESYYMQEKREFSIAKSFLSAGDWVLEIGGGRGAFGRSLETANYTGLEFNRKAVSAAGREGLRMAIESVQEHATRNRGRYDVLCSFQVLEHMADPRGFLEAAMSCLKKSGLLIISVPSYDGFLRGAPNDVLNMPPHHVTLWSDRALLNLAGLLGAEVVHMQHEKIASYHFLWFVQCSLYRLLHRRSSDQHGLLELAPRERFLWRVSALLGRLLVPLMSPLVRALPEEHLPNGHTAILVLRKL